jgi:hypothetical protein
MTEVAFTAAVELARLIACPLNRFTIATPNG